VFKGVSDDKIIHGHIVCFHVTYRNIFTYNKD